MVTTNNIKTYHGNLGFSPLLSRLLIVLLNAQIPGQSFGVGCSDAFRLAEFKSTPEEQVLFNFIMIFDFALVRKSAAET